MNHSVFGKLCKMYETIGHKTCKTRKKKNFLVPEPNYHAIKIFHKRLVGYRNDSNSNTYEQACLVRFINIRNK